MAIRKEIEIDGKKVPFKASATIPRLYRFKFQQDIFRDLQKLEDSAKKNQAENSNLEIDDLELFENVAFIMAKHADSNQPDSPEEWLDQFNVFSIYEVLPTILDMWAMNTEQEVESKKKLDQVQGN